MDEKRRGKLGTLFYIVIIPIILTIVFGVITLQIIDVPVWKTVQAWGNNIPILNKIIPDPTAQADKTVESGDREGQYLQINDEIKSKDQKIAELNEQLLAYQNKFDELKRANEQLKVTLENNQTKENVEKVKQVVGIYANIPESKAAAMFESMPIEEATVTLSLLGQELQSNILGKMKDAKKAAQITLLMKEIPMLNQTDQAILKQQIYDLSQKQENPAEILAETIAGMPPAQSAVIIQSMMDANSQVAMGLMKNVNTTSRSQILTEIAKEDSKLAAQIAARLN